MAPRFGKQTPPELARLLRVHPSTVARWVDAALAKEPSKLDRRAVHRHPLTGRRYIDGEEAERLITILHGAEDDDD